MANPRYSCLWNVKSNFLWAFEFDDHPSSLCCANIKSEPVVASTTTTTRDAWEKIGANCAWWSCLCIITTGLHRNYNCSSWAKGWCGMQLFANHFLLIFKKRWFSSLGNFAVFQGVYQASREPKFTNRTVHYKKMQLHQFLKSETGSSCPWNYRFCSLYVYIVQNVQPCSSHALRYNLTLKYLLSDLNIVPCRMHFLG